MKRGFFTILPRFWLAAFACLLLFGVNAAGFPKGKNKKAGKPIAKETSKLSDSLSKKDTLAWMYAGQKTYPCWEFAENTAQCFRKERGLFSQELGLPGSGAKLWSAYRWRPVANSNLYSSLTGSSEEEWGGLGRQMLFPVAGPELYKAGGHIPFFKTSPLDTPFTQIFWERGALELNVFQLDFKRNLSRRVYASLEMSSYASSQIEYDYPFQAHQLALSGFGIGKLFGIDVMTRDSSDLVITGNSLASNVFGIQPSIGVQLGDNHALEFSFLHFRNKSQFPYPGFTEIEHEFYTEKNQIPEDKEHLERSLQFLYRGKFLGVNWDLQANQNWWENFESALWPVEEDSTEAFLEYSGQSQFLNLNASRKFGAFTPSLFVRAQNLLVKAPLHFGSFGSWENSGYKSQNTEGFEDWEVMGAGLHYIYSLMELDVSAGAHRLSNMENKKEIVYGHNGKMKIDLPYGFEIKYINSFEPGFPHWKLQYLPNAKLLRMAQDDLLPEKIREQGVHVDWMHNRLSGGIHFYSQYIEDPLWNKTPFSNFREAGDWDLAVAHNGVEQSRELIGYWAEVKFGNWKKSLEHHIRVHTNLREKVSHPLFRSDTDINKSEPSYLLKGSLEWENRFVFNRLRVNTQWNWEYWPLRYGYIITSPGTVELERLNPYLALDFLASMQIRSFKLIAQVKNFYHQRYAIQPGSHPEGINMRWGVQWSFKN